MKKVWATLWVFVAVLGMAVSGLSAGARAADLQWVDCPAPREGVRCGMLAVPENWQNPVKGQAIRVHFVHIPAKQVANKKPDPIAFLTGGPGVSIYFGYSSLINFPGNDHRDVIAMEPRGYGYSEPWLGCASVDELSTCYQNALGKGIDVTQYTTANTVRDYEALRKALGYGKWNLAGVSYGTYWASLYARMFPDSIRTLVMDSPYPLNAAYDWNRVAVLNALDKVFIACKGDKACNRAYPDLRSRFINAMMRLIGKPDTWQNKTIGPREVFYPIFNTVYIATTLKNTPLLVDALARRDYETLFEVGERSPFSLPEEIDPSRMRSLGLNAAMLCMEDIFYPASIETRVAFSSVWPKEIVEVINPEGWDYDKRCAAWPMPRHEPSINEPLETDIPALVMVGAYDPVTPPEFAQAMLLHMRRGVLVLDPSTAHVMFLDPNNHCAADLLRQFVDDPDTYPDMACLGRRKPVAWVLPE